MKFTPTLDRVFVEEEEVQESTPGGIIIPELARGKNDFKQGKVLAVGPGKRLPDGTVSEPGCKKGQTVVFDPVGCVPLTINGTKVLVMRFENILATEA